MRETTKPRQARQCVEHLQKKLTISERRVCGAIGQPRSTQRQYRTIKSDEEALRSDIVKLARQYGRYGYRRITALLRRDGWQVNHKRVERIWRQEGLKVPKKQPKRGRLWLNDGSCIRLRPVHRNHVWSYDFMVDRTHDGRAIKMLTVIDEYTREALAIVVARKITSAQITVLNLLPRLSGAGLGGSGSRPCSSSQAAPGKMDIMNLSMESLEMRCSTGRFSIP